MATYFQGAPEMQPDGLQTLYLMNPSYVGYPDTAAQANMVLLNSAVNPLNAMSLSQSHHHQQQQQQQQQAPPPPQQHHFVGIPLQQAPPSHESNNHRPAPPSIHSSHGGPAVHGFIPRLHYNLWSPTPQPNSLDQLGHHRPSAVPQPAQQGGLSLSLASQEMAAAAAAVPEFSPEEVKLVASSSAVSAAANGAAGLQSFLMGSKYLNAAQQLLDEVVNVGKGSKGDRGKGPSSKCSMKSNRGDSEVTGGGSREEESAGMRRGADLTTAERQELQMKKAKLINMLDEVEQRYRQYHHQMQIVVSSFEAVAGVGSARTYTALALQTISKQFRCLRDAITLQIRSTSKSLGEEDPRSVGSRLRFVDHHLRQQRALQQLGMIQHNAWRPQRGLPERSVSILRAWLFEHFLHPYPKDSDKLMLAKQTGLTRSQVSNWFINARVRLWKPMVEEMYLEEMKDQEQNNSDEKPGKDDVNEGSSSRSNAQQESSPTRTGQTENLRAKQDHLISSPRQPPSMTAAPPSALNDQNQASYYGNERAMQHNFKKAKSDKPLQPNAMPHSICSVGMKSSETSNSELLMKFMEGRRGGQGYPLIPGSAEQGGGFGAYPIADIGRFGSEQFAPRFSGNGVSLTLGLPQCENLSLSGAQPSFLSGESIPLGRRLEIGTETSDFCSISNNPSVANPSDAYESINIQDRKRFAAHLLPDFVA